MKLTEVLQKPESLRNHVENFLRNAIISGNLKPGERLVERELCKMLVVSRPSLREALRKLEAEKLITTVLHRGPVVATIGIAEARDLYTVRMLLEGYAAREFTRLADDHAIKRLEEGVQRLHSAAATGDHAKYLDVKFDIYDVILTISGNQLVAEILKGLSYRVQMLRGLSLSQPERLSESLREFDRLLECIKARDPHAACEAARAHVLNAQQATLSAMEQKLNGVSEMSLNTVRI